MKILITGYAGFIGSHFCELALKNKHTVYGIDNLDDFYGKRFKEQNVQDLFKINGNFIVQFIDIRNKVDVNKIVKEFLPDIIVHIAAVAGVRYSFMHASKTITSNVLGTTNVLEAAKDNNIKKLIFISSSSVYGDNKIIPFLESHKINKPISLYAASKLSGEFLCKTYAHAYGLNIACLRLFSVYGPRQRPDLAIRKFISLAFRDLEIPMYGDGSTSRDYTHVNDIVNGIYSAMLWLNKKRIKKVNGLFEIFNLGNNKSILLKELMQIIQDCIPEKQIRIIKLPMQLGDVQKTYANIDKAKKILNYRPKIELRKGIEDLVKWFKNLNLIGSE